MFDPFLQVGSRFVLPSPPYPATTQSGCVGVSAGRDPVVTSGEEAIPFRLRPGEAAVKLEVGVEREVEKISESLRRFW